MDQHTDFPAILRDFMARSQRTAGDLARLTGLSLNTLKNWTGGVVQRPRVVSDLLTLARALALDLADTNALLRAAGHPPLATLHAQAEQTGDHVLAALLATWPPTPASNPASVASARAAPAHTPCHQLRAPVADFVGRAREIDQLATALRRALAEERGAIISGVQGMGGIGKTELAYAIAHRLRDAFPDAQLVLNLRGSSPNPLTPSQMLQAVIHTLSPEAKLADDLPALEQHYRSLLHRARMLILADDARDAAQVQALIPPVGSAVLITSRRRFSLPGMATVQLEQLREDEAVALLRAICPRLDMSEAELIARACGHLPLALRISGGILQSTPALPVTSYIAQLGDERQRLRALRDPDDPQLNVEASLALSYAQLDEAAQRVFRQLGVVVADFASDLARAVVEAPDSVEVDATLHLLLRRNLVMYDTEHARWRLHDLLRDLARRYLEDAGELEPTMWRYAQAALQLTEAAEADYLAGRDAMLVGLARFDAERPHIDAGQRWAAEQAGTEEGDQLLMKAATATVHIGRLRYDRRRDIIPLWERVLAAAQRLGDQRAEGFSQRNLGGTYYQLGETWRAIAAHEQALTIARALDDQHLESIALNGLGNAYVELGEARRAIRYYEQALTIIREIGDRRMEGTCLQNLGDAYTDLDDARRAIEHCEASLTIAREIGEQRIEGCALKYLARAQARLGDLTRATTSFEQALTILHEIGDYWGAAEGQWLFGLALTQQGERERALPLLRAAVAYEQEIGHARAAEHAALLARLETGEELPSELLNPAGQRAVGEDGDASPDAAQS